MKIIKHDWKWAHGLSSRSATNAIIMHHAAAKVASPEDVHAWHLKNGWAGIGYHLYIRKDGSVHEGRPLWASGAQTLNYNSTTLGICCEGNYDVETVMPAAQLKALREVLAYLKGIYPTAAIKCHRDFNNTACPGKFFPVGEAINYGQATAPVSAPASSSTAKEAPKMGTFRRAPGKKYQVGVAQSILIHLGYLGAGEDDEIFGAITEAAVKAFQKAMGLLVDGVIGPETWAALLGVM